MTGSFNVNADHIIEISKYMIRTFSNNNAGLCPVIFSILLLFLSLFRLLHYKHNLLFFSDCIRKICPADCSLPVIFDCRFSFCKVRNPLCFQFFQSGNLTLHIAVESASGAVQTGDHTTHSQIDQFISKWFRICHPQVFSELF